MKILVVGAGGIVGQHMIKSEPKDQHTLYMRRSSTNPLFGPLDLCNLPKLHEFLDHYKPDVIVNLAGENRVDVVESTPSAYRNINLGAPVELAYWCNHHNTRLIQLSTQGVFSGNHAPYAATGDDGPLTEYGKQKAEMETSIAPFKSVTLARLTFVLGIRPFPEIGRRNPFEDMIEQPKQLQVDDRFFSPVFAHDAARVLWDEVLNPKGEKAFHIGIPMRVSRFQVAADLKYHTHGAITNEIMPISHEYFTGIAPRPYDTTWAEGSRYYEPYESGLITAYLQWKRLYK